MAVKDATKFADELRDKTDAEVVFATLATVDLAAQQAPTGGLENCLTAARGGLVVLIERFVPREVANQALAELYGDDHLTLIQGGRDA